MSATSQGSTLLIVNPASAGGKTLKRFGAIRETLQLRDVKVDVIFTSRPLEATSRTREAIGQGYSRVVAVGGDGTLNEVVNGYFAAGGNVLNPDVAIGLIPSGTGGDFRRSVRLLNSDAAIAALIAGTTRQIDAGRIEVAASVGTPAKVHHFINIADWGVGGEVVTRVNSSKFKASGARGSALFLAISLSELLGYGGREIEVTVDGNPVVRHFSNVIVANGRYFGGGMKIAPLAMLNNGTFDVVLVSQMSPWQALRGLPRIYRGTHLKMDSIELLRGSTVQIASRDPRPLRFEAEGEELGAGDATVTCLKGAIKFVAN